jgi:hypothetical protein
MADIRECSMCGKVYGPDYADTFCLCGFELVPGVSAPAPSPPPPLPSSTERPAAGTRCLVLYGPDKQPLRYFPLIRDATLVGRQDPVAACFPDIDVSEWLDPATARKVSREHALIVHSRANDTFALRPLAGNTGTQLENDMVPPMEDFPLQPGQRLILGGVVRLKFEVT